MRRPFCKIKENAWLDLTVFPSLRAFRRESYRARHCNAASDQHGGVSSWEQLQLDFFSPVNSWNSPKIKAMNASVSTLLRSSQRLEGFVWVRNIFRARSMWRALPHYDVTNLLACPTLQSSDVTTTSTKIKFPANQKPGKWRQLLEQVGAAPIRLRLSIEENESL